MNAIGLPVGLFVPVKARVLDPVEFDGTTEGAKPGGGGGTAVGGLGKPVEAIVGLLDALNVPDGLAKPLEARE